MKTPEEIDIETREWMDAPLGPTKWSHTVELRPMQIGERIRLIRMLRGYSLRDLAAKCDVSYQAIYHWESGIRSPRAAKLRTVCDALEVSSVVLFAKTLKLQAED